MADDPISDLVDEWPTAAVISTIDKTAKGYNPRQTDTGAAGSSTPVVGFYSTEVEAGADYAAMLTLKATEKPAHLTAGVSRAQIGADSWLIQKVQTRRWEGKINGFTLELVL